MILHRAYDGLEWVFGTTFAQDANDKSFWWYFNIEEDNWYAVSEPQAFTGLVDKHGTNIFEGDIVKFSYKENPHVEHQGIVKFKNASFCIETNGFTGYKWTNYVVEVIGNETEEAL